MTLLGLCKSLINWFYNANECQTFCRIQHVSTHKTVWRQANVNLQTHVQNTCKEGLNTWTQPALVNESVSFCCLRFAVATAHLLDRNDSFFATKSSGVSSRIKLWLILAIQSIRSPFDIRNRSEILGERKKKFLTWFNDGFFRPELPF